MIKIRKATLEDADQVIELFKQFPSSESPDSWQENAAPAYREVVKNDEMGTVLVAEEEGDVIGVLTLSYPVAIRCAGVYTCIEEFIVSERARGKGVGGQLIEAAIAEAASRGCYEIQVNNPSELGYPVYLEHGFKDIGKHLKARLPSQAA